MNTGFKELGISDEWIVGLSKQEINTPTEIQCITVPEVLKGKDIFARSQTGTGKTLAFLLPILTLIDRNVRGVQAIILTPTHELASQIAKVTERLIIDSDISDIRCALIIGGANPTRQLERLKEKPQIIVGSPGRILELIGKRKISPHTTKTIVIDEADRMLDEINVKTISAIIKTTLKERQILMFSATKSKGIEESAANFSAKLEYIQTHDKNTISDDITHIVIKCEAREKTLTLRKLLAAERPKKALVFLGKGDDIKTVESKLDFHNLSVAILDGTTKKHDRRIAIDRFRNGSTQVLLCSDLAARGLDINGVTHVINYSLPEDPIQYLHRAGRCGRNGQSGKCFSLVITDKNYDLAIIHKLEKTYNIQLLTSSLSYGKVQDVEKISEKQLTKYRK